MVYKLYGITDKEKQVIETLEEKFIRIVYYSFALQRRADQRLTKCLNIMKR